MSLQQTKHVLTHLGYSIRKDALTELESQALRKALTVAPKTNNRFKRFGDSFTVFQESPQRFYLPRVWALEKYGPAEADILVDGDSLRSDLKFVGTPYDYQEEIVSKFLDSGANGLICVPCGRGKTFMAIWTALRIGKKFIIVVDKEFLLQQWSEELKALVPGIRIGILQSDTNQVDSEVVVQKGPGLLELKEMCRKEKLKVSGTVEELKQRLREKGIEVGAKLEKVEYDCTIAMIQTLVQRDFAETQFRPFGFAVFDECHHLGASNFSKALLKVQPKKMLGLSATPTRDDGLTCVFEWFLGKPVHWEKTREADPDVIVRRYDFQSEDEAYASVPMDRMGEIILARLLTQVCESEERSQAIDALLADLTRDSKRRILVLSERKSHLERIERGLAESVTRGWYIGGMKEEVREEGAKTAQVLLGTYAMASEAMNIKTLNTMIMVSPRKKIEQSTGRILRVKKDAREVHPMIIDIVDSHDVYQNQWLKRRKYYRTCAYKIEVWDPVSKGWKEESQQKKKKQAEAATSLENATGCMILDD